MSKLYKPREIARLGMIKNTVHSDNEDSNYSFILKLIKTGKLRAKNVGLGKTSYWLISAEEIRRYNRNGFVKQN